MGIRILLLTILFTACVEATTVNGRFIPTVNETQCSLLVQLNTDTGVDDMGGATIVIGYDAGVLTFSNYVYHNFSGGNYSTATVTNPQANRLWLNIDLPYYNSNNGTVVAGNPQWTNVVTIVFNIVNPNATATFSWQTTSMFWGIYDGNNIDLWNTGLFEDISQPLPVELSLFEGVATGFTAYLRWITETEVNCYGFEVERDGQLIGFVAGSGNSNSPKEYKFTYPINRAVHKYRLKMIDIDGSFTYSNEITIKISDPYDISLYPNPFNSSISLMISVEQKQDVEVSVYSITGELIERYQLKQVEGFYILSIDMTNQPTGVYLYVIQGQYFTKTLKGVLIK